MDASDGVGNTVFDSIGDSDCDGNGVGVAITDPVGGDDGSCVDDLAGRSLESGISRIRAATIGIAAIASGTAKGSQMTLQEQRDIIQAAIDGKAIEFSERGKEDWRSCDPSLFNFGCYDYRVRSEPREWWVLVGSTALYINESRPMPHCGYIKVREVLE